MLPLKYQIISVGSGCCPYCVGRDYVPLKGSTKWMFVVSARMWETWLYKHYIFAYTLDPLP